MKRLVLDGNSILNRAFYGIKLLTTKNGQYTNAIFGFMNILLKLKAEHTPDEIAIAFDLKGPTFRHKMYTEYKGKRKGMPEELAMQIPLLKELLGYLGYKMVTKEGYEADDILGTLALAANQNGDECFIATGDRDSLQLIQPGVFILLTATRFGKTETFVMDKEAVQQKYGVTPKELIDVKALMGDASDNIPGVAGVGEKTAFMLIQNFHTLDGVYENIDSSLIKPGMRKKLLQDKENAYLSYKLGTIDCHVPIPTELGAYTQDDPNIEAAQNLLSQLEMHTIAERIGLQANFTPQDTPKIDENLPIISPSTLPNNSIGDYFLIEQEKNYIAVQKEHVHPLSDDELLSLLANKQVTKNVFGSKALYKKAIQHNIEIHSLSFDAQLAAYLLNPAGAIYQVDQLAAEYAIAPTFRCEEYPEAGIVENLYQHLKCICKEQKMDTLLKDIEQPLAHVLADMEITGIATNPKGIEAFGQKMQKLIQTEQDIIYKEAGYEFNINSPKQLGEALFDKMELPHGRKTKTGWSTDAKTLDHLKMYSPIINHILDYRTYQKLNSTYVEGLLKVIGEDGRIHSTFNQTETRTGRISSNDPNLQNIPIRTELGSQMRAFFVSKPGCVLVDADYSQIELRILAHIAQDKTMQEAFLSGQDIHKTTAAKVNHLPLDMVTPDMRSDAKAVNFGIVYGIGPFSLSKDIGTSVKEAKQFIDTYLDTFPGVRQYSENAIQFARENGYSETLYGRKRPLPELSNSNKNVQALGERMALNTPIQGTAADIIKLAMNRVFYRLQKENLKAKLVLQVHDELIIEAPENEVEQVSILLKEEMENAAQLSVPLTVDIHTGYTWLEAKG